MRLMQVHTAYTHPGGEDAVAAAEAALLRSRGHEVLEFRASNAEVLAGGRLSTLRALADSVWNRRAYERMRQQIRKSHPSLIHVHNVWFALSPSVLAAAKDEGVPTVMTLHNFRLVCPGAYLMRGGKPCEVCLGRSPWHGVFRRCYRGSALQTALVARMIGHNRRRGTWANLVDAYIALTGFCRDVFVRGGLPAEKIVVKPNFVDLGPGALDLGPCPQAQSPKPKAQSPKGRALFVGRLSPEKGVRTLLAAWPKVREQAPEAELRIVGDGPERPALERLSARTGGVSFAGQVSHKEVLREIESSACLVMPSECYETFGRAIIEAYACGRPVVASRLGSMAELVRDGETGLLSPPGDPDTLATKLLALLKDPSLCARMGRAARAEYEARYTPERNYEQLMRIYSRVIQER